MSILGNDEDVYNEYLDKIDESTKNLDDFIVIECHISHPGNFFYAYSIYNYLRKLRFVYSEKILSSIDMETKLLVSNEKVDISKIVAKFRKNLNTILNKEMDSFRFISNSITDSLTNIDKKEINYFFNKNIKELVSFLIDKIDERKIYVKYINLINEKGRIKDEFRNIQQTER